MLANSHPSDGRVAAPPLAIPCHMNTADEVSCTVIALDDDDIVLVRLDAGNLSIELPLAPDAALDFSLRLCACAVRLRKRNTTVGAPCGRARSARRPVSPAAMAGATPTTL